MSINITSLLNINFNNEVLKDNFLLNKKIVIKY